MSTQTLFADDRSAPEVQPRDPVRPLRAISTFVVEEMPQLLAAGDQDLFNQRFADLAPQVPGLLAGLVPSDASLAKLDLTMLGVAHAHLNGGTPTPSLRQIPGYHDFCERHGFLPFLSYEDVIFANPLEDDPRAFTTGETGVQEVDFYRGHKQIEKQLEVVITGVQKALQEAKGDAQTACALEGVTGVLKSCCKLMQGFNKLKKSDFAAFRDYFNPEHTDTVHLDGPSGKFSAKVQALRMLLLGAKLEDHIPGYFAEIQNSMSYYPQEEQALLADCLVGKLCVLDRAIELGKASQTYKNLVSIEKGLTAMMSAHLGVVGYHLGKGMISGTGGEADAGTYLKARLNILPSLEAKMFAECPLASQPQRGVLAMLVLGLRRQVSRFLPKGTDGKPLCPLHIIFGKRKQRGAN